MPESGVLPFPVTDIADDEVVLRCSEHAAIADFFRAPRSPEAAFYIEGERL